jgi:F0F1-type ATP synthase membrane subunit c/vacuolar-type H+-ATPase subunit K
MPLSEVALGIVVWSMIIPASLGMLCMAAFAVAGLAEWVWRTPWRRQLLLVGMLAGLALAWAAALFAVVYGLPFGWRQVIAVRVWLGAYWFTMALFVGVPFIVVAALLARDWPRSR